MARFIAIPVSARDAFYLSREGFSVLVDGGRSAKALPDRFRSATRTDSVTILLCTHNDADHANGILGYLQSGLDCEEVWLPGSWLSVLPNVLGKPVHIGRTLLDQVAETNQSIEQLKPDGDPLESIPSSPVQDLAHGELNAGDNGWPRQFEYLLEQGSPWSHALPNRIGLWGYRHELVSIYLKYPRLSSFQTALLWSAIDAATRIRAIAHGSVSPWSTCSMVSVRCSKSRWWS